MAPRYSWAIILALAAGACVLPRVENARILAVETIAGKSHWNFMSSVLRALTENGHNVTVLTPFPEGDRENYTEVDTSAAFPTTHIDLDLVEVKNVMGSTTATLRFMAKVCRSSSDVLHENEWLQSVLADGDRLQSDFDAIVIEPCRVSGGLTYPAVIRSSLPLVFTVPAPVDTFTRRENSGHFHHPATVSSMYADHAVTKTFAQRFANTLELLYSTTVVTIEEGLLKTFDPKPYDTNTAPVSPSLVFTNNHFISDGPRPIEPNVISVGGIHLRPPKQIPNDILKFIEDSRHGVVLFTFGSTIAISSIPKNIQIAFKKALAQLPQRVLLKYESEMEDKPTNVMTKKWLPQRDILLHPNVRLFISHGGISGTYEAVDAGVSVLGFPLFGDQPRNIDGLVEAGMAISMEILSVTTDTFLKNIVELINNKKYSRNAKIASDIFKDRPMTPEKSVVYWTEYVIRHKGAPHLKSHALNLTWYQYMLLDVIAVVLISCFIILFIMHRIFKIIYKHINRHLCIIKMKSE